MATFITSKLTGETIGIDVQASTGYWKYNHNGTDSSVFSNGYQTITVTNANGEFTIISCLSDGTVSGDITYLNLNTNQLTSFDGTGLSGLTQLYLSSNQLTSFDGTGLSGLTQLYLDGNQLTGFTGTGLSGLTSLELYDNQLTSFDGTGLSGLTQLYLGNNQLTSFDGTGLSGLTELYLDDNQLTSFDGTGLSGLTNLGLGGNQLTSFDGTGLSGLTELDLQDNQLTSFDETGLSGLTYLGLGGNQLTTLDISNFNLLQYLYVQDNQLTPSVNNTLLAQLATNELTNNWNYGEFSTTGGRTSAGTADYDTLISRGWTIEGAGLVSNPVWYRFKALGTQWINSSGQPNNLIKYIQGTDRTTYPSNGYSYFDFLTDESFGTVTFDDGNGNTIEATQVQVTLQEFSSSGSFNAGIGLEGSGVGYANTTAFGSWGTLNSGTLPAIPSRYEGFVPAGSVIFSDVLQPVAPSDSLLVTAPILLSLTVNGNTIGLPATGNENGTSTDNPFGFEDGETYTFSITWGELVEATPPSTGRKLRVKGVGQLNP